MRVKQKSILITLLLAIVCFLAGVFVLFSPTCNDLPSASAVENNSDDLYFSAGAYSYGNSTDLYKLRFVLNIKESLFDGAVAAEPLTIQISEGQGRLGFERTNCTYAIRHILKRDLDFTDGIATLDIFVSADLYEYITLKASFRTATAKSDSRSVYYIWEKAYEYNALGGYDENVQQIIRSTVELHKRQQGNVGTGEISTFGINEDTMFLSRDKGLTLSFTLPYNVVYGANFFDTNVEKGGLLSSINLPSYTIRTTYYFVVSRATHRSEIGNSSYQGDDITEFYYCLDANDGALTNDFTLPTYKKFGEYAGGSFDSAILNISLPSGYAGDNETSYYWYAKIVKVTKRNSLTVLDSILNGSETIVKETQRTTVNFIEKSMYALAEDILARPSLEIDDGERSWLQNIAGVAPSTKEVKVLLCYKTVQGGVIVDKTETFLVKSVYAQNFNLVFGEIMNLKGLLTSTDFNAVYTENFTEQHDGIDFIYNTGSRIVLQGTGFNYTYDSTVELGIIDVIYSNFYGKDLALHIYSNEPDNHLSMSYFPDVVEHDGNITLSYQYEEIEEHLYNSCKWLFDFGADDLEITNVPDCATVTAGDTALTITVPKEQQAELVNISLTACAEIVEDVEYNVTYQYIQLGYTNAYDITETVVSKNITMWYSELTTFNFHYFMAIYGKEVNDGANLEIIEKNNGVGYITPIDIRKVFTDYDDPTRTCTIEVIYDYRALFKITNNYDDTVRFKTLSNTSLLYTGEQLVESIPDGCRVDKLSSASNDLLITNDYDYTKATVRVTSNVNSKTIFPVCIEYTNLWFLTINYFKTYASVYGEATCFAEKAQAECTIKVKDFPDIYSLTSKNIQTILGVKSLEVCGMVDADDKVTVTFDGVGAYTATLTYGTASLRAIDYNGNIKEIQIPLTSYVDWCNSFGKDFTILMLNTKDRRYFQYSNDIERERLYGFFSVAVFDEQISDLNYWFQNNTGDGQMTLFTSRSVKGSTIYKFFDNLTDKGILTSLFGYVGMAFCEIFDDDNHIEYSYYFYLDGSCENAYLSNGGADDAFDTDSAFENAVQDLFDLFNSGKKNTLGILLGCVGVLLIFLVVVRIFNKKPTVIVQTNDKRNKGKKK